MTSAEHLINADGANVLVRQTHPPFPGTPVAMRGVLRVIDAAGQSEPTVTIALSFPSVFTSPPEERTLVLDDAEVDALLASERDGVFEYTLQGSFDDLRTRMPVARVIKPRR